MSRRSIDVAMLAWAFIPHSKISRSLFVSWSSIIQPNPHQSIGITRWHKYSARNIYSPFSSAIADSTFWRHTSSAKRIVGVWCWIIKYWDSVEKCKNCSSSLGPGGVLDLWENQRVSAYVCFTYFDYLFGGKGQYKLGGWEAPGMGG